MIITLNRESTDQQLTLDLRKSIQGIRAIRKAMNERPSQVDLGLLAPDFEISFTQSGKKKNYLLYDRGYFLMDPKTQSYWIFKYGNKWYNLMEEALTKLLEIDPKYFLKPKSELKKKQAIPKDLLSRTQMTTRALKSEGGSRFKLVAFSRKKEGVKPAKLGRAAVKVSSKKTSKQKTTERRFKKVAAKKKS